MRWSFVLIAGLAAVTFSPEAHALEVTCSDGPAECTIDNEFPSFECSCNGQPGSGSTGASENPWEGLNEQELLAECIQMLSDACADDTAGTGGETGGGTTDATGPDTATSTSAGTVTDSGGGSESASASESGGSSGSDTDAAGSDGETSGDTTDKDGCAIGSRASAPGLAVLLLLGLRRRFRG